ncbi:hypothetical protein D9M68_621260 [compost metagenome]
MIGPTAVSASCGSPTFTCRTRSTKHSAKASYNESSTMMRLIAMQICPWCRNLPNTAALTACSRSASASTTKGLLPPSSRATCLRCAPPLAMRPILRPTGVEPVKVTRPGSGCSTKASPISLPAPTTTLSTPAGSPASSNMRASSKPPHTGVSLAGLTTTALPSARAGASERWVRCSGKFHGLITPTTPMALRYTRLSLPGMLESTMRPCTRLGKDADSRVMARAAPHSSVAFRRVLPDSRMIQSMISSRRRSNTSTTR